MADGVDLLDIADDGLYYDEPAAPEVSALLVRAAGHYGEPEAEHCLLRAYFLAPEQLIVLVGLYRYYYYQHRLEDALLVAERSLDVTARRLGLLGGWRRLDHVALGEAAMRSIGLLRFHLLALKASAVARMRLGQLAQARERLAKVVEIDRRDLLGAGSLLALLDARLEALGAHVNPSRPPGERHDQCHPV